MKFLIHVDSSNYIIGLELTTLDTGVSVPNEVYNSPNQNCYKYVNNEFIFDNSKKERLDIIYKNRLEIENLKKNLTNTDYIWNVIKEGDHDEVYYKDVIEQRHEWRMRVRELEEQNERLIE